jgi:hypothetical protein
MVSFKAFNLLIQESCDVKRVAYARLQELTNRMLRALLKSTHHTWFANASLVWSTSTGLTKNFFPNFWPDSVEYLFCSTSGIFKTASRIIRSRWGLVGELSRDAPRLHGANWWPSALVYYMEVPKKNKDLFISVILSPSKLIFNWVGQRL